MDMDMDIDLNNNLDKIPYIVNGPIVINSLNSNEGDDNYIAFTENGDLIFKMDGISYNLEILGRGTTSKVYTGEDNNNNKIIIKQQSNIKVSRRLIKRLRHKNGMDIFDILRIENIAKKISLIENSDKKFEQFKKSFIYINDSNIYYFGVYDFINGRTMAELVKFSNLTKNYFSNTMILTFAIQINELLYDLQINEISHGDLHFDNIMYDFDNNKFKIIDFGFSCNCSGYLLSNKTPFEIMHNEKIMCDKETKIRKLIVGNQKFMSVDMWSLGIMLYELASRIPINNKFKDQFLTEDVSKLYRNFNKECNKDSKVDLTSHMNFDDIDDDNVRLVIKALLKCWKYRGNAFVMKKLIDEKKLDEYNDMESYNNLIESYMLVPAKKNLKKFSRNKNDDYYVLIQQYKDYINLNDAKVSLETQLDNLIANDNGGEIQKVIKEISKLINNNEITINDFMQYFSLLDKTRYIFSDFHNNILSKREYFDNDAKVIKNKILNENDMFQLKLLLLYFKLKYAYDDINILIRDIDYIANIIKDNISSEQLTTIVSITNNSDILEIKKFIRDIIKSLLDPENNYDNDDDDYSYGYGDDYNSNNNNNNNESDMNYNYRN